MNGLHALADTGPLRVDRRILLARVQRLDRNWFRSAQIASSTRAAKPTVWLMGGEVYNDSPENAVVSDSAFDHADPCQRGLHAVRPALANCAVAIRCH